MKSLDADVKQPMASVSAIVNEADRVVFGIANRELGRVSEDACASEQLCDHLAIGRANDRDAAEIRDVWRTRKQK